MKKRYVFVALIGLFMGCSPNDDVTPVVISEEYINKLEGTILATGEVDLILDGSSVGRLSLSLLRDSLFINYALNPDVIVKSLKFHASIEKENLPSSEGKLVPESFQFSEKDFGMPIAKITGSSKYKGVLFFSFFCKVSFVTSISEEQVVEAKIKSTHGISDESYFKAHISAGSVAEEFLAYCLQGDQAMDTSFLHSVKRLSSLSNNESLLASTTDSPDNLDLVNWVLNQDPDTWIRADGAPSNGADRQMAIWKLIEKTGNPTGANIAGKFDPVTVNKIVKDAHAKGNNFKPSCGDKVLYILHKGPIGKINPNGTYNTGNYSNPNYQMTGIIRSIDCYGLERVAWAHGKKYSSEDIATYFVMYRD